MASKNNNLVTVAANRGKKAAPAKGGKCTGVTISAAANDGFMVDCRYERSMKEVMTEPMDNKPHVFPDLDAALAFARTELGGKAPAAPKEKPAEPGGKKTAPKQAEPPADEEDEDEDEEDEEEEA